MKASKIIIPKNIPKNKFLLTSKPVKKAIFSLKIPGVELETVITRLKFSSFKLIRLLSRRFQIHWKTGKKICPPPKIISEIKVVKRSNETKARNIAIISYSSFIFLPGMYR